MEFVLVVPRDELFPNYLPQGFFADPDRALAYLDRRKSFFVEREYAEVQPSWKQIIPYCLVVDRQARILVVRRTSRQGEGRLHNRLSIGLGGHINPEDSQGPRNLLSTFWACVRRELSEELVIGTEWQLSTLGYVNYDSDPVGAVHFGVVVVLQNTSATIRETENMVGDFRSRDEVLGSWRRSREDPSHLQFERWSASILETVASVPATWDLIVGGK